MSRESIGERVTCNFFSNNTSVLLNFAAAYSRVRWVGAGLSQAPRRGSELTLDLPTRRRSC